MKAALIATGNEIVSGQILNSNTSWLANELSKEGLDIHFHMAVLDNKDDLLKSLQWLKGEGINHIFMCGGLGPTRDDLTRQIVADFCEKDFDFYEPRWVELEENLKSRCITPRQGHKWQCYFPLGATHLINTVGTAWGFQTETKDKNLKIWTLPGPPNEFENVYLNSIKPWLRDNIHNNKTLITWQCFNTPESEVAHITEEALKGCTYEVGYRASPPITEVKLWVPNYEVKNNKWCKALDNLYSEMLYSKNGFDYFNKVLSLFGDDGFFISDSLTKGDLLKLIKLNYKEKFKSLTYVMTEKPQIDFKKGFSLIKTDTGVSLNIRCDQESKSFHENIDLNLIEKSERMRKYVFSKLIKESFEAYFSDNARHK